MKQNKERWVVFTDKNAVVVKNPSDSQMKSLMTNPLAFKDPQMFLCKGVPPHYWKPPADASNVIQVMTPEEMQERARVIAAEEINNNWELPWAPRKFAWFQLRVVWWSALTTISILLLIKLAQYLSPF